MGIPSGNMCPEKGYKRHARVPLGAWYRACNRRYFSGSSARLFRLCPVLLLDHHLAFASNVGSEGRMRLAVTVNSAILQDDIVWNVVFNAGRFAIIFYSLVAIDQLRKVWLGEVV
jgi:hypothetical protein